MRESVAERERFRLALSLRSYALAAVALHHAILILHAVAHEVLLIALTSFQEVYVAGVIVTAPLVAVGLLFTRFDLAGAILLAASMLGALAFGIISHALLPGPDNVFDIGTGTEATLFQVTGILLSITEAWGTWVGTRLVMLRQAPRPSPA